MTKLALATALAIGCHIRQIPYIWGGDDWRKGLDCSGFIGHLLRKTHLEKPEFDTTANGLMKRYPQVVKPAEGCLVFYGSDKGASHVMYCLNEDLCIGMVNGDSTTTSPEKAAARHAYCEIRPIKYRTDILGFNNPFTK